MRDFADKQVLVIITNLESANANLINQGIVRQEDRFCKLLEQANNEKKTFNINNNNLFQKKLSASLRQQENIKQLDNKSAVKTED